MRRRAEMVISPPVLEQALHLPEGIRIIGARWSDPSWGDSSMLVIEIEDLHGRRLPLVPEPVPLPTVNPVFHTREPIVCEFPPVVDDAAPRE